MGTERVSRRADLRLDSSAGMVDDSFARIDRAGACRDPRMARLDHRVDRLPRVCEFCDDEFVSGFEDVSGETSLRQ